jgi:hypothetical protein
MNWLKALFWLLVGVGLTLYLSNDHQMVQRVGTTLCLIALLGRLLLYLRDTQPSWERINAVSPPKFSILEPPIFEPPNPEAAPGSTPVQRLIDDERSR